MTLPTEIQWKERRPVSYIAKDGVNYKLK